MSTSVAVSQKPSFSVEGFAPLQKHLTRDSAYIPTYRLAPSDPLPFDVILDLAQRRSEFHRHLAFHMQEGTLDYEQICALSFSFAVPLKRFTSNAGEIETDVCSFFALMLASLDTDHARKVFAEGEERLCYCRMAFSGVSATQIPDYLWLNLELRDQLLGGARMNEDDEVFFLPMEQALMIVDPWELELVDGTARWSLDGLYKLVSGWFGKKILGNMGGYEVPGQETLAKSLAAELERLARPISGLTLENLPEKSARSFPPCMLRILASLKNSLFLSFKARTDLFLFLQALGFDYIAQYRFWKGYISTDQEQTHFEEQIVIELKQMYGLDDPEEDYAPQSCVSVVNHASRKKLKSVQGCPFCVKWNPNLKCSLAGLYEAGQETDIESLSQFMPARAQQACVAFFNARFPARPFRETSFEKPVDFFYQSELRFS
jgi:hypothetical protein